MVLENVLFKKIFIGVQLIYNVVLVSGAQQSESVIHMHISTLFQILFPYRPLQSTEQSSLCYTVGPYQLSILYIVVCICQSQSPNLSLCPFLPGNHKFVFYTCNSTSAVQITSFVCFFLDSTYKQYHMIFVFLCLTYITLSMTASRSNHVAANGINSFFFYG